MSPQRKATASKSKVAKRVETPTPRTPTATKPIDLSKVHMPGEVRSVRLGATDLPWQGRRDIGKALRERVTRESHGETPSHTNRPDPLDLLAASNVGRQKDLVPLRMGRMAASPFAFFRGAACVMAWDLSKTPKSGINVIIDGDAHVNNFGFYGTPQRDVIFDLNDFDEATVGPWEWDVKRLVASVNIAGRENGLNKKERADAVVRCVDGYRWNIERLQNMGVLDVWYLHAYPDRKNPLVKLDPKSAAVLEKCVAKAKSQTNASLLAKSAERDPNGTWRLREDPVLSHVDDKTREKVIDGLELYSKMLAPERAYMLNRYRVVDVGHRIVGVGSVGTRAYLALLLGNSDDDALFLQIKEATAPAHAPYLPPIHKDYLHHGRRVVMGQRALQASSDVMLGETTVDGRPFFVRQMKNMKASIPIEFLTGEAFEFFMWACGSLLARAHARTGDAAAIAGYCGGGSVLDKALAKWAEAYGDQNEQDHQKLVNAIASGKVQAIQGV